MRKQKTLTILAVVTAGVLLAAAALIYAYSTTDIVAGGSGAGWSCSKTAWTIKLVRAGQPIQSISRAVSTVSVTLTGSYPNNNLKVGQKIVISGVTGADAAVFNGTFTIATVPDQTHFTYTTTTSGSATGTVDASSIAGGDYTSLVAWEAAEGGDLVSASNTAVAECYNDWSGGLVEDLIFFGNTTDAEHYMKITAPASERNNGTTETGFRLVGSFTLADNEKVTATYIEVTGATNVTAGTFTTVGSLFTGGLSVAPGATIINTLTDYLPQYFGGVGAGWAYAEIPDSPLGDVLAETVKLIRAGQAISAIARAANVVSVTLDSAYPNSNLKVGQSIKIDTGSGGTASFNGTFTIATVTDQSHFTYAQTADPETGTLGTSPTAGGDYSTLSAWHTAVAGNFISPTPRIETAECYNDWGASGLSDNLTIIGNTTDSNRYLRIKVPTGERHTGTTGTGFKLDGTLTLSDSEHVKVEYIEASGLCTVSAGNFTDLGSLYKGGLSAASGATVNVGGSGFTNWGTVTLDAASTIVYIGPVDNSRANVTLINAAHGNIALNNSFCTFNLPGNFTVNGNLFIGSANTLDAKNILGTSSYDITLAGNWTNNGTFIPGTGTVTLSGADQNINGSSTFYRLTKDVSADAARTLTVASGTTQEIATGGTLTLKGASGKVLTISSTAAWYLNVNTSVATTYVVDYVDAAYSNAAGGKTLLVTNSTDSLNNVNWDFGAYDKTWTGTTSTAWATATNWSEGAAPVPTDKVRIPFTTLKPTIDVTAGAITIAKLSIENGATLTMSNGNTTTDKKLIVSGDVRIYSGGNMTHTANAADETHKLNLSVGGNLTIDSGGLIKVDGMGYSNRNGPGYSAIGSSDVSYGGLGNNNSGPTYGSITAPVNLGTGGSTNPASGSAAGGGAIQLTVSGLTSVSGTISAKGISPLINVSGGSGGSIYLTTGTIAGAGSIAADGVTFPGGSMSSGGGRVAIILTDPAADFSNFATATVTAYGGANSTLAGAAGTVYKETGAQHAALPGSGTLIVDNNDLTSQGTITTLMPVAVDVGAFSQVIIKGKGNLGVDGDDTLDLSTLNLSTPDNDNTKAFITILPKAASTGAPKYYTPDNVTLGSGATITNYTLVLGTPASHFLDGIMGFTGPLTVSSTGNITHLDNSTAEIYKLNLYIDGNLTIASGGTINVDGLGYDAFYGPGKYSSFSAASHGGLGGYRDRYPQSLTYGSITAPVNLGSGGSAIAGGGAVKLWVTGALANDGTISASAPNGAMASSGGSIYITTGTIATSATGLIEANGGASSGSGSAGGGGRVSIILTAPGATFPSYWEPSVTPGTVTAYGGLLNPRSAAAGTVYRATTSQGPTGGVLTIANFSGAISSADVVTSMDDKSARSETIGSLQVLSPGYFWIGPDDTLTLGGTNTTLTVASGATFYNGGVLNLGGKTFTNSGTADLSDSIAKCRAIASSSDGANLIAGVFNGRLYTSTDSAATWTECNPFSPTAATDKSWAMVASSADGSKLIAGVFNGRLYTSNDSGATWTERNPLAPAEATDINWASAASSSNGAKLIVGASPGRIFTSDDYGVTWTERRPDGVRDNGWVSVASSSDGVKLIVCGSGRGLWTSADSGVTWTSRTAAAGGGTYWGSTASSADGTKLIAGISNAGRLWTSSDSGASWTERNPLAPTAAADKMWYTTVSDSTGANLIAYGCTSYTNAGRIYISNDYGVTWTERRPAGDVSKNWQAISSSASGAKLVAWDYNGQYYTSTDSGLTWSAARLIAKNTVNYTGQTDNSAATLMNTPHSNITLNKSGTTFNLPVAGLTVYGDWKTTAGTLAGNYTVTLAGKSQKLLGSTSFYSLNKTVTAADTLYFDNTAIQSFGSGGTLTLAGASGQLLSLRSCDATGTEVAGTYAHINPSGNRSVSYVDVKDNYNDNATAISATNSQSSGHNINWDLGTYTWTGTTNTDWATATNWAGGVVPGADCTVVIPATANDPILAAPTTIGKLTITGSGAQLTCNTAGNLTVTGDITVSTSGILKLNGSTLTCSGNITFDNTSTLTEDTSTIVMNASSGTKTLTLDAAKTCYALTFSGPATFNFGTTDVIVGGSSAPTNDFLTVTGGATVNAPTGTLTFRGSGLLVTEGSTFNHNNGTVLLSAYNYTPFNVDTSLTLNNLTINSNNSYGLFLTAGDTLIVSGTLRLQNGFLGAPGYTGTIDAKGSIEILGTFDGGTGTLVIDGASDQSFQIQNGAVLPKLTLNQAATTIDFADGANVTITGALTLQAGTFTSTSGTLTLTGSGTVLDTTAGGTFDHNNGTVSFANSGAAQGINFNTPLELYSVILGTSNRDFTIPAGKTLVANGTLTLTDGFTNTGSITAKGDINIGLLYDGIGSYFTGGTVITLSGTNDQTITSVTRTGALYNNMVIDKDGGTVTYTGTNPYIPGIMLTKGTLTFAPGNTYNFISSASLPPRSVASGATLNFGAAGGAMTTVTSTGSWGLVNNGTVTANMTDVKNCNYSGTGGNLINPVDCIDSGNNANPPWNFNADATAKVWNGTTSSSWNTAANWTPSGVPTATNSVVFNATGNLPCVIDTAAVCKNMSISSGYASTISFDPAGAGSLAVSGNFIEEAGIFDNTYNNASLTVAGNWSQTGGTFTHGSGTVDLTAASGTQTVTATVSGPFYNLTHSGAGTLTPLTGAVMDIKNNFVNSAGAFLNTNNINMSVGGSINLTGTATFTPGTSIITLSGQTARQVAPTITSAGKSFYDITLNTAGANIGVGLADNLTVTHGLTLTAGSLSLNSYTLNLAGASFSQNAAALLHAGTGSISGTSALTGLTVTSGTLSFTGGATYTATAGAGNGIIVPANSGFVAISGGGIWPRMFALALKSDGTVYAWGENSSGQLGNDTTTQSNIPVQVLKGASSSATAYLTGIIAISGGSQHSLALKSDGTVYAWGDNSSGQLGNDTTVDSIVPVQVSGLTDVIAIAGSNARDSGGSGGTSSYALKSDGTVWAWGRNTYGQLGNNTTTQSNIPVQVLKGASSSATAYLTGITAIEGSDNHAVALKSDGTVWAWGRNLVGQLGDDTNVQRNTPVQVLKGASSSATPYLTGVIAISSHGPWSLALKSDGTVWAWGFNATGQLGDGSGSTRFTPVQVLKGASSSATAYLTGVTAISAGPSHSLALKSDGTVYGWGSASNPTQLYNSNTVPVQVPGLTDIAAIYHGYYAALALKKDGTIYAWGNNTYGNFGDNTTTRSVTPVTTYLTDVKTSPAVNFNGTNFGSMVTLRSSSPGTTWYYDNAAGTTTTANYVDVKDSTATTAVTATFSVDSGNLVNWNFSNTSKLWLGTTSSDWATAANWSGGVLPTTSQVVAFNGLYSNPCVLDSSRTINRIAIDPTYASTLTLGSNTLTVTGSNANFTGGTLNATGSTLKLAATAHVTFTPGSHTFNNIEFSPTLGYILGVTGTATVAGNLTVTNGLIGSGTLNVAGDVSIGAGADTGGAADITLNGTGAQAYTIASPGKTPTGTLTINKASGTATITGTGFIYNINVTQGILTFNPGTYTISSSKTITVAGGQTLNFAGTSPSNLVTLTGAANWNLTKNGTVTANYVAVDHSQASADIIASNSINNGSNAHWVFPTAALSSWDLDMDTQKLILTFANGVNASSVNSAITSGSFVLQNAASSPTATYALTNSSTASVDGSTIVIDLSTTDFNAIVDTALLCKQTDKSDSFLSMGAGVTDMADNAAVATVSGMQTATYTVQTDQTAKFRVTTAGGAHSMSATAGEILENITIKAYDASGYRSSAYVGDKTVTFSGAGASPDPVTYPKAKNKNGSYVNFPGDTVLTFANGRATTAAVVLYNREEPAMLCAAVTGSIDTDEPYDLEVTVAPELQNKLVFTQQPSTTGKINIALTQQPMVEIRDLYGNRTDDTNTVTLYDSTTKPVYNKASGTIANASIEATSGTATFSGVTYDKISTIYMQARVSGITSAWSDSSVVFSTMANGTVDAVVLGDRISNFNLIPTKDDLANKFAVLRFNVTDAGGDLTDTLIDQLQVAVAGTGANASTDIAWAGVSKNRGTSFISTPVVIANGSITFGSAPDSNSTAAFDAVADGTATEYTVYVYMKNSKLTATDGQTYTFGVNESLIGVDQGLSSQMTTPANANVDTVAGTIAIAVTHLEVVTEAGASSANATAGAPLELVVRAVDENRNIDINYGPAPDGVIYTLKFYGLSSSPNNTSPKIEDYDFGNNTAVNFISGVSSPGVVTLTAYNAETASIEARQYSGQTNLYTSYPISVTVASAAAGAITATSGSGQVGKTSKALPAVLMATVKDNYGNLKPGAAVTFTPSGNANISPASTTTNSLGQATTTLTLGTAEGAYTVSAATGALPPAEFTATGRIPRGIYIAPALEGQSAIINQTLVGAYVVKLVDVSVGNGNAIPNETITFNFQSIPSGADTQSLTVTSATTDASGQVTTLLTLGQIVGDYVVRATYAGVTPNVTKNITATALSAGATKIVLTGPSSITAGSPSSVFTITSKDEFDNIISIPTATNFDLTTNYAYNASTLPGGGRFYSDSACTAQITQATIGVGSSSATFYYKQTGATGIAITAAKGIDGHPLPDGSSSTISGITVLPAGLDHFKVTAGDVTPIVAGVARDITVTAYDIHGNPATNLGTANVKFKFIDEAAHLSGDYTEPVCGGVSFGSSVSLAFSGVNATSTASLVLYKPETSTTAIIKAYTDSGADTSNDDDLAFTVRHGTADHVVFGANLPSPVAAGSVIDFDTTLNVVDPYGNICDGANGATAYAGSKTIVWTLSGTSDAPDGLHADTFTNPVSFAAGASTTALTATLYRAQNTTITANIAALPKTVVNTASNQITVNSGVINKLVFDTQTPLTCITSHPLDPQPRVAVGDAYGNPCSSAIANITLMAVTDTQGTLATNGMLGGTTTRAISSGVAQFSGITYDYPEAIYLQATVSGVSLAPEYSTQIQFSATTDLSASALNSQEKTAKNITGSISSMANTTAAPVYGFKVADAGSDGRDGLITKVTIQASGGDTTGDWTNYIADAWLTDTSIVGATPRLCTVAARSISCGDGVNTIFTVPNGNSASPKAYVLSVTLKSALPSGADGKVLGFTISSNTSLKVNTTLGSTFPSATVIADSSLVAVTATDLKITGSVSAIAAGGSLTLSIRAIDANSNIDKDYSGEKSIRVTGANPSPNLTSPTCTDNIGSARNFAVSTLVTFASGVNDPAITEQLAVKLYNAEVATISVSDMVISSSVSSRFSVTVSGGSASQLFWDTQPVAMVVANAPWKPFVLSVADAYGNTSSSTSDITVTALGAGVHAGDGAVATVAASAGLATFNNYFVWCDSYPGAVTLNASADGVTSSGPSDSVQVDQTYDIVLTVKDTVTATQLSGLSFKVLQTIGGTTTTVYGPITGNSPFILSLPYGKYTFMMTLDKYVDSSVEETVGVSADGGDGVYDNVVNWTRYMTTLTEATADYRVIPSFVYDEDNDDLYIRLWLERRGKLILNTSVNILGQAFVDVYDDATQAWLTTIDLTPPLPSDTVNGTYVRTLSDVVASASNGLGKKLVSGKTYFAKCRVYYGGLLGDGTLYEAGVTFTITNTQKVGNEIISKLGVPEGQTLGGMVADVQTNIAAVSTKVDTTSTAIIAKVDTVSANVSSVGTKVDTVQATSGAILDSVATTLPAKIDAELAKGTLSEMLTRYTILREDDSVKIRYRTTTGLAPKLTIYKPDGTILPDYNGVTMDEISNTGIYEYEVTAKESWGTGDFTAEASEGTKGSKDSMVLTIKALYTPGAGVEESIDAVGEAVSKVYTRQKSVEGLLGGATDVKSSTTIFGKVNGLNSTIDSLNLTTVATDAKNARMNAQNVYNEMENLKKAAGDAQAQASSLKELSRQLSEMQANLRKTSLSLGSVSAISGTTASTTTIIGQTAGGSGTGAGLSGNAERDLGAIKRDMAALKKGAKAPTLKEEDIKSLNNRVEELTALVKLLSKTMEATNNKPVVEGWFEQG